MIASRLPQARPIKRPGLARSRGRPASGCIMARPLSLWPAAFWPTLWAASAVGLLAAGGQGPEGAGPEVATDYGRLRGRQAQVKGTQKRVSVFLGVPFASPPTGSLRFSPPQPPEPWDGVRDATSYPAVCPQELDILKGVAERWKEKHPPFRSSEDCLYLNIYTPAHSDKASKLPVMVWIHGGNFVFGAASRYDGSALAAYGEVLVVTLQYRLGILGFFSTGDQSARGNWGLLDQVAALQWIQGNIEPFGGDPERVTLFGGSAGSFCVSAHVLSPLSKGLFHRAILHSSTAILPGSFNASPQPSAEKLARALGCEVSSLAAMVECLRQKSVQELTVTDIFSLHIVPVMDGEFMPKTPEDILTGKEFSAVPLMAGVTNNEFGWNVRMTSPELKEVESREKIHTISEAFFPRLGVPRKAMLTLLDTYLGETDDPNELRDRFLDLLGDAFIVIPTIRTLNYHKESGAPVYFFEYQHRPSLYHDRKPPYVKADHADEISFVFGGPFLTGDIRLRDEATEEERHLSRTMMAYWASFAHSGKPGGEGLVEWPPYDAEGHYLELGLRQRVSRGLKAERVEFWAKLEQEAGKEAGHAEL